MSAPIKSLTDSPASRYRKKINPSIEQKLRTTIQTQKEDISKALENLKTAEEELEKIEKQYQAAQQRLQAIPEKTVETLKELSSAIDTYNKYAVALENSKVVFNLSDIVKKTQNLLAKGDLLKAHENILELEHVRDDLLYEVHVYNRGESDKTLLQNYFADVEVLSQELGKQLWYICNRALAAVQGVEEGRQKVITALKIIEKEERVDKFYLQRRNANDTFMPSGRPRKWRSKLFEVLNKNVVTRIEGNQIQERSTNKHWLAVYLEVCRKILVDDLMVIKSGFVQCFPPEYQIYDRYINMYHTAISKRLEEIASEDLQKNEIVQLLAWVKSYGGPKVLGNPRLNISTEALLKDQPLLQESIINQLYGRFVDIIKQDFHDWSEKALNKEKDDWYKHSQPDEDNNGCFYTPLPSMLFGMIEDTVALTKEISIEVIPRVIDVAVNEFLTVSTRYRIDIMAYKAKHFENRSIFKNFTATLITVANNLDICSESTDKLIRMTIDSHVEIHQERSLTLASSPSFGIDRQELIERIESLKTNWYFSMQSAIMILLDEIYEDIQKHLDNIMTKQWLMGSEDRDAICMTIMDYHRDYEHLRPHIRYALLEELLFKVVGEYIIAIDARRLIYTKYEERHLAAERLRNDSQKMEDIFAKFLKTPKPMIFSVLSSIAGILDLRDKSLLTLETASFVRKYPDVTTDFLTSLIGSREDVTVKEAKTIADAAVANNRFNPKGDKDMVKLFSLCRQRGKKILPAAIEETMQNVLATLKTTTRNVRL